MVAARRGGPLTLDVQERRLLASRVALAFAGYGFLICREEPFARIPYRALAALVPVCFAAFLVCLWPVARRLRRGELVDLIAFEAVGAAASAITLFVRSRSGIWSSITCSCGSSCRCGSCGALPPGCGSSPRPR